MDREDAQWMSEVNATPGSARALARTVRDVIDWRGQRRNFLDHVEDVPELPPIALFWGDRDRVIPVKHAYESTKFFSNVPVTTFFRCGHFPHHQVPEELSRALLAFLDASAAMPTRFRRPGRPGRQLTRAPGTYSFGRQTAAARTCRPSSWA